MPENPEDRAVVDQQYAANKQDQTDLATAKAYYALHPDELPQTQQAAAAPTGGRPSDALLPKQQEANQAQAAAGEHLSNLETATTGAEAVSKALNIGAGASMLLLRGVPPMQAIAGGALLDKAQNLGAEATIEGARKLYGEGHPVLDAISGILGGTATGAGMVGATPDTMSGIQAAAAGVPRKVPQGTVLDAQGQPMTSAAPENITPPLAATEGGGTAGAPTPAASAPETPAAAPTVATPTVTPESAAASLAERQIEALKTVRVGKTVATEFGAPDIATKVPEAQTIAEGQIPALRAKVEPFTGVRRPTMAAETAALAGVYTDEAKGLTQTAQDLVSRAQAGEDVTADLSAFSSRYSAFAVNYANIAGARSEMGRGLQILDPLKPGNAYTTAVAKMAQSLDTEADPMGLAQKIATLTPEQAAMQARSVGEAVSRGRSIYDGFLEYYKSNLLSSTRTAVRVPISNMVTTAIEIPTRFVAALMPGGTPGDQVNIREPWAMIRGIHDALPKMVDYSQKSWESGQPEFSNEANGTPMMARSQAMGAPESLKGTWIGDAMDYAANVIRTPFRALTAAHQAGQVMASFAEEHAIARSQSIDAAAAEGLSGAEGSMRADEIYNKLITERPQSLVDAAAPFRKLVTFSNDLGPTAKAAQTLIEKAPGGQVVIPFFKVYANATKYGAQYIGSKAFNLGSEIYGNGSGRDVQIARGRLALGAMMSGIIAYKVANGDITGEGNYMTPEQKQIARQQGWAPNSFRVHSNDDESKIGTGAVGGALIGAQLTGGEKKVQYFGIPEGIRYPISVIANTVEALHDLPESTAQQKALAVVIGNLDALTDSTLILGVKHLQDMAFNPEGIPNAGTHFLGQTAQGLVPFSGAMKGIANTIDPVVRDTQGNPDDSMMEQIGNQVKSGLPGWSKTLYPQVDALGNDVLRTPGVSANMIFPVNVTQEKLTPKEQEILNVGANFQRIPQAISGRPEHLMDDPENPDVGVPLSAAQQYKMAKERGSRLSDYLDRLLESPAYQNANKLEKQQLMNYFGAKAIEIARVTLLRDDSKLREDWRARMRDKAMALIAPDATGATGTGEELAKAKAYYASHPDELKR